MFKWTKPRSASSVKRDERMLKKGQKKFSRKLEYETTAGRSDETSDIYENCENGATEIGQSTQMESSVEDTFIPEIGICVDVDMDLDSKESADSALFVPKQNHEKKFRSVETQASVPKMNICIESLMRDDEMLHYYTGLGNYSNFSFTLQTLGLGAYHLKYRKLKRPPQISVENQFLITLIRLRRYMPYIELAFLFGIRRYTVSSILCTWINFMYCKWRTLTIWPTRDLVRFFCPEDFKRLYPTTRIILDGVEVPIAKPSNSRVQQITFSSYKNRNTLKTVPGITPGGLVSYIPDVCGGSVSDRMFVERSNLPSECDPRDSVMVDKGFDVQDIFAIKDITVNVPTFLKKGNQFSIAEMSHDRKIASKRVHVERVIGLAKTYKILREPLNDVETILGERIIFSCFMLCNMRNCIVPYDA